MDCKARNLQAFVARLVQNVSSYCNVPKKKEHLNNTTKLQVNHTNLRPHTLLILILTWFKDMTLLPIANFCVILLSSHSTMKSI